jgi:hypothetical protein
MSDSTEIVLTDTESSKLDNARGSAAAVVTAARDLIVETEQEAQRAGEILRDLQTVRKRAEKDRLAMTKPHREHVELINRNYREPSAMLEQADRMVREKVKAYLAEQERIRAERQAEIDTEAAEQRRRDEEERERQAAAAREQREHWEAEQVAREAEARRSGTQTDAERARAAAAAAYAMAELEEARRIAALPVRHAQTVEEAKPMTGVVVNQRWMFEVTDQAKVPESFKVVDETAVRKHMREDVKAGRLPSLCGIRFFQEESLSVRGR